MSSSSWTLLLVLVCGSLVYSLYYSFLKDFTIKPVLSPSQKFVIRTKQQLITNYSAEVKPVTYTYNRRHFPTAPSKTYKKINISAASLKTILTFGHGLRPLTFGMFGKEAFLKLGCPEPRCIIVSNDRRRTNFTQYDAVIFRGIKQKIKVEIGRKSTSRFIYYERESPAYDPRVKWRRLRHFYNWTMTYRRDSDIPAPYGFFRELSHPRHVYQKNKFWWRPDAGGNQVNIDINTNPVGNNKKKIAVNFASHCVVKSNREEYKKELSKYISLDIYGDCGNKRCKGSRDAGKGKFYEMAKDPCFKNLKYRYYFYLALENSLCHDYITEKLFDAYKLGLVPVVYGGANYARIAPPHSYINVMDFGTPRELGKYLEKVASNNTLYRQYFWWRDYYTVETGAAASLCSLCQKLHSDTKKKVIGDIGAWRQAKWWGGACQPKG